MTKIKESDPGQGGGEEGANPNPTSYQFGERGGRGGHCCALS